MLLLEDGERMKDNQLAVRHLKRVDPVLRCVIEQVGPCPPRRGRDKFGMLTRSILHQQLAVAAAETIAGRFCAIYGNGGNGRFPKPEEVLQTHPSKLRAAGVSRQKAGYIKDLARHVSDGTINFRRYGRMDDEAVIENLTQVKGIGRWTAEMFLLSALGRPDVWAIGDLGLQLAVKNLYGLRKHPSPKRMVQVAKPWQPFRSVASWYLWRSRDL